MNGHWMIPEFGLYISLIDKTGHSVSYEGEGQRYGMAHECFKDFVFNKSLFCGSFNKLWER